jgi:hypothetical protein
VEWGGLEHKMSTAGWISPQVPHINREAARFENSPAPETIGRDLLSSIQSQSFTEELEAFLMQLQASNWKEQKGVHAGIFSS